VSRRYIVAGPPCAGKTTFVEQHKHPDDLVFDYDVIQRELSGRTLYDHDPDLVDEALAIRERIFEQLERDPERSAWIITATPRAAELRAMRDRLGAQVVLLQVDRGEAHRRCDADDRPSVWHDYVDRWFERSDIDPAEWPMPAIKGGGAAMTKKRFVGPVRFKDDGAGRFRARFSTFNVIDHDGDVVAPTAFKSQEGARVPVGGYNHDQNAPPVGSGTIHSTDTEAIIDGRFFLSSPRGKEYYESLKALREDLGPDGVEWSYIFETKASRPVTWDGQSANLITDAEIWSVDPVLRGASLNTALLEIKSGGSYDRRLTPLAAIFKLDALEFGNPVKPGRLTPQAVALEVAGLSDPGSVRAAMDERLQGMLIDRLEARLAKTATGLTNLERLRRRVRAQYPDASTAYVDVMTDVAVQDVAFQMQLRHRLTDWEAQEAVGRWAAQG
jgi:predicted kinase